jgi:hypothetical protein
VLAVPMREPVHAQYDARTAARHFHVFASLRPWWISQRYLAPHERPVDLPSTVLLLAALTAAGVGLMVSGTVSTRQPTAIPDTLALPAPV